MSYTEVKGKFVGAFLNSADGFNDPVPDTDATGMYLDGIGARSGTTHLYSLALGHVGHHCSRSRPGFLGDNYTCIVGSRSTSAFTGPYPTGTWTRSFSSPLTDDITVQLMADSTIDDEDIAVQGVSIAVR